MEIFGLELRYFRDYDCHLILFIAKHTMWLIHVISSSLRISFLWYSQSPYLVEPWHRIGFGSSHLVYPTSGKVFDLLSASVYLYETYPVNLLGIIMGFPTTLGMNMVSLYLHESLCYLTYVVRRLFH